MVLGYLMFKENLFAVKGGPNPGPRQQPPPWSYAWALRHYSHLGAFRCRHRPQGQCLHPPPPMSRTHSSSAPELLAADTYPTSVSAKVPHLTEEVPNTKTAFHGC
jgi:hypothetical protein